MGKGDAQAVGTSLKKGGDFMKKEVFDILLNLIELGVIGSLTITDNLVTIRIKK